MEWVLSSSRNPRFLLSPEMHYFIHNSLLPVPILSQIKQLHALSYFLKIIPPRLKFPKVCFSLMFPHQKPVSTSPLLYTRHLKYTEILFTKDENIFEKCR